MPQAKKAKGDYKVTLSEISQEIDLEKYIGRKPKDREVRLFAELAIEQIKQRTLDGQTFNGGKFKKYTKRYADFKGVTQDSVDLFLEGDLLDSITVDSSSVKPKIYVDGDLQVKKGYNHHVGDTLPKRSWWGLRDDEAEMLAEAVKEVVEEVEEKTTQKRTTLADLRAALDMLEIEQVD